jgi:hypothetical protein
LQKIMSLGTYGILINSMYKWEEMVMDEFWQKLELGVCIQLFQKNGSVFRFW